MNTEVGQPEIENKFDSFKTCSSADVAKIKENRGLLDQIIHTAPFEKLFDYIETFIDMVDDYFSGFYTEVPFGTIAALVGTLLYIINPLDLIPDFIPFIGFIDDAAMVGFCLRCVKFDVDRYRQWYEE